MFVGDHKLVYFAFPKCGSEFIRYSLNLNWIIESDPYDWDNCSINYCHIRPNRFISENKINIKEHVIFSIVRNPFERLVSCWHFFILRLGTILSDRFGTFENFVNEIYNHKNDMSSLPCYWFYMPMENYFDGILNDVLFFKLENISQCIDWLQENFSIEIENKKINVSSHDHYSTYYTPEMIEKVNIVFNYELARFDYTFDVPEVSQPNSVATQDPN